MATWLLGHAAGDSPQPMRWAGPPEEPLNDTLERLGRNALRQVPLTSPTDMLTGSDCGGKQRESKSTVPFNQRSPSDQNHFLPTELGRPLDSVAAVR